MSKILKIGDIVYYSGWDSRPHISGFPGNTGKYRGIITGFEIQRGSCDVIACIIWFHDNRLSLTQEHTHCLKIIK